MCEGRRPGPAKANPGKLQFTGTTPMSPDEIIIMLFAKKAGIKNYRLVKEPEVGWWLEFRK